MRVTAILNPKGGCGKTTLATNLSQPISELGKRVLLVESARDRHAARDNNPIPLVAMDRAANLRSLENVGRNYDFVIIDGAAKLENMIAAAIKVADAF